MVSKLRMVWNQVMSEDETDAAILAIAGATGGLLHKGWRGGPDTMGIDFEQFYYWYMDHRG